MNDRWAKTRSVNYALYLLKGGQLWTSYRKFRLFACACCSLSLDLIGEYYRDNIRIAELLADVTDDKFDRSKFAAKVGPASGWGEQAAMACVTEGDKNVASRVVSLMQSCCYKYSRSCGIAPNFASKYARSRHMQILHNIFDYLVTPIPAYTNFKEGSRKIAEAIYRDRSFEELPVLADSLEDDGVMNESLLAHLRSGGPHFLGTWSLDIVLGKS